jgi:Arc/MetJ-type ribon-helix-helix transcriptional regulator
MNADIRNYMEQSKEMNSQLRKLMAGGSFENVLDRVRDLKSKMRTQLEDSQEKHNELQNEVNAKTAKNPNLQKFKEKREEILFRDKAEIQKFDDLAKSRLDTIKFKKLPKVKEDSETQDLFRFFFVYLYKEPESRFSFNEFTKFALKKNVDEFKKRLAQFNVRNLGKQGMQKLEIVDIINPFFI